jgi:integrase
MAWKERVGKNSWRVRFRRDDDTIGNVTGFTSEEDANNYALDMESDQRKGSWIDPTAGQLTINEFIPDWLDALDVDSRTEDNYRSILRNHIQPRWGKTALAEVSNLKVQAWRKHLRASGLATVTVDGFVKLLSLLLSDAADEKLIGANPIRGGRRRGRRQHHARTPEKVWAEPDELLLVVDNMAAYYGPGGAVMTTTAGWTGARWGELTSLQRRHLHLFDDDTGYFDIDPDTGALHEDNQGNLWLGPPKTPESARRVHLAPFNVRLLRAHLHTHDSPTVFPAPDGGWHRRSNFSRRAMRPAADGTQHHARLDTLLHPAKPGLTFHGTRHGHKTWMIADAIPEAAQDLRLGHLMPDKVRKTYSHIAPSVEARLLECLQERWEKAVLNSNHQLDTTWRAAAKPRHG